MKKISKETLAKIQLHHRIALGDVPTEAISNKEGRKKTSQKIENKFKIK